MLLESFLIFYLLNKAVSQLAPHLLGLLFELEIGSFGLQIKLDSHLFVLLDGRFDSDGLLADRMSL